MFYFEESEPIYGVKPSNCVTCNGDGKIKDKNKDKICTQCNGTGLALRAIKIG